MLILKNNVIICDDYALDVKTCSIKRKIDDFCFAIRDMFEICFYNITNCILYLEFIDQCFSKLYMFSNNFAIWSFYKGFLGYRLIAIQYDAFKYNTFILFIVIKFWSIFNEYNIMRRNRRKELPPLNFAALGYSLVSLMLNILKKNSRYRSEKMLSENEYIFTPIPNISNDPSMVLFLIFSSNYTFTLSTIFVSKINLTISMIVSVGNGFISVASFLAFVIFFRFTTTRIVYRARWKRIRLASL
ncbi:hypothetical protein AGLY_008816 [Aphis glycines]|uniref:Uncharacterized protein n=1 Tax=Aphis glycines TaxID=307491 RepID=A0A6G0TJQ8_APHGL|nr:hypothetical protein AGLY_008816 [Aphis glycines]